MTLHGTGLAPVDRRFTVPGNRWDLLNDEQVSEVDISVVVSFFEDQPRLDLILAGLSVQTHPPTRLQVVIADDGSRRPPIVPEWAAHLDVSVVRQDDHGFRLAAARNLGALRSDGDLLAFLDGDTVPEPEYLERLCRLPALLPDAVVGGRRRHADFTGWSGPDVLAWLGAKAPGPEQLPDPEWLLAEYRRSGNLLTVHPHSYKFLIGAVLACHREMFDEIRGFDDSIVGYGGEDYDFTYRAFTAGAVLAHVPGAVAWHDGPEWAVREADQAARTARQNAEVVMLAERIPEPSSRGRGQWYPVCDLIVELDVTGWSLGSAVLSIRSFLMTLDCGVWLTGRGPEADTVRRSFLMDSRVRSGEPDRWTADRARARLRSVDAVTAGPGLAELLDGVHRADIGWVEITDQGRTMLTIETSRAAARSRRSGGYAPDLFETVRMTTAEAGLDPVREEPSLPATFGGWQ